MDIKEAIEQLAKDDQQEIYSVACTVTEVNEDERTCAVTPLNGGVAIFGVRLQAIQGLNVGLVVFPEVNSQVIVTFINKQTGYVALCTQVSKVLIDTPLVEFNGGDNGGLINIADLVTQMNAIEADINTLKSLITSWIPAPGDGGAALKAVLAATYLSDAIEPTLQVEIEDNTVTH